MNWWEALHIALSIALFVGIFWISDDEPFTVRLVTAAVVGLLWLPILILIALFMLIDAGAALWRKVRK